MMMRVKRVQLWAGFIICILLFLVIFLYPASFEKELATVQQLSTSKFNVKLQCLELKKPELEHEEIKRGSFLIGVQPLRPVFSFRIHPQQVVERLHKPVCDVNAEQTKGEVIVHFVKSGVLNERRRDMIRATWAAVKTIADSRHEVVFIVGTTAQDADPARIDRESRRHGDILQPELGDGRNNLPLKVLAGMQWASTFLRPHWLYTSCDDDVTINPFNLVKLTRRISASAMTSQHRPCYEQLPLICLYSFQPDDMPARDPSSKWYVSTDTYPSDRWPAYCRGGLYAMPARMATQLYAISRRTPYLFLDDVWITGIMRLELNEGDSNIYAAPQSRRSDYQLKMEWNFFNPLSNMLVRHLWGDIHGDKVNVSAKLLDEWQKLGQAYNDGCHREPAST